MPKSGISIRSLAAVASACTPARSHQDDSAIQMQMEESERATLQSTLNARPINTKRKYEGYQKEFVEWCNEKVFLDGATVTKSKLHLFLTEQVVGRVSKKTQSKIIGGSTVCGYVNSIVDLYSQQVALKTNSNEHPRSLQVKQLIRNVQAETTETRKKNYVDRGIGSLLDGYQSETQFRQICDTFFSLDDVMGRAAFSVSHYGLLRGENIRDLELSDMFSQKLDSEGFQSCTALMLLIQHGKTNTFGKLQHVGFMRNKDVHLCPVGAVAFYLFQRFHLDLEPFPSFRQSNEWYDIKFLCGRDRTKPISYNTHKKHYEKVFKHLDLTFNKKTHINRQQGDRQLENADVDVSQTRRQGRWGLDTVEAVYSAPLAREAIRALSGFPPRGRLYFLERDTLQPPDELIQQVFPSLDECKHKLSSGEWENNLVARGLIAMLEFSRVVLLQDSAFLFQHLPARFQSHSLFREIFQTYRGQALARSQAAPHHVEMQLQVAMSLLSQQIITQHSATMEKLDSLHSQVQHTQTQLTSLMQGDLSFRLVHAPSDTTSSIIPADTSYDHSDSVIQQQSPPWSTYTAAVPRYSMSRCISTVHQLWTEWYTGLNGNPSIAYLENKFGTKWRSLAKEFKFYSRRLHVIKYVRNLVNGGLSVEAAIEKADEERGNKSIDSFSKYLRRKQH